MFPIIFGTTIYGQVISNDDLKTVVSFIQNEDFKGAFDKTGTLLSTTQNDASDMRGFITYINILSAAGMVAVDQMTSDEFSKNANKYIGQKLVMLAHPCVELSPVKYNSLGFRVTEGKTEGFTYSAKKNGSSVLCVEHFRYTDAINPADFLGKNVRCGGTLESIEVNKSKLIIAKLHIANAFARVLSPR